MIGKTFIHYVAVMIGFELPHTQTTEAERDLLLTKLPGRRQVVEVGVFEGFTTKLLADAADAEATVYGVDPFFAGRLGISWGRLISERHNRKHLASGKVKFLRTLSTEVKDGVPQKVDFVFMDADHSLKGIAADWAFWSERVVPGGIVALHDTLPMPNRPEYGTHEYFRSHIQYDSRFQIIGQRDSLSIMHKTK